MAKIRLAAIDELADRPKAKYVLVSAVTGGGPLHPVQPAAAPGVELIADGLAHSRHGRLGQCRLWAQRIGQAGFHVAHRQTADKSGDHLCLQRVGLGHCRAEQPGDELLVGAPQLRPLDHHRPAVVFTVVGQKPLREPGRTSGTSARRW